MLAAVARRTGLSVRSWAQATSSLAGARAAQGRQSFATQVPSEGTVGQQEVKQLVAFRCGVAECGEAIVKAVTRSSLQQGTVIIQCPHCQNKHLIADNHGWFGPKRSLAELVGNSKVSVREVESMDQLQQGVKLYPGSGQG